MDNDFLKILKTAVRCPVENIEEYLIEEQLKSHLSPKIFFGILLKEIQNQVNEVKSPERQDLLRPSTWPLTRTGEFDSSFFDDEKNSLVYSSKLGLLKIIINTLIEKAKYPSKSSNPKSKDDTKNQSRTRILIIDSTIKAQLFDGLKQYFSDKEDELKKLLTEGTISEKLVWPLNQNQLADLFLRLNYNGYIMNDKTEIKNWLVQNFTLANRDLNSSSIYETLTRKNEIKKEKRILENLAPFKPKTKII
jgi:hypothetical protein